MGMRDRTPTLAVVVALAGLLSGAPAALAQSQTAPPPQPAPSAPTTNLDTIKAALSHPPALNLAGDQMRFYLEISASSRSSGRSSGRTI